MLRPHHPLARQLATYGVAPALQPGWTHVSRGLSFAGRAQPVAQLFEGTVPEPILTALMEIVSDHRIGSDLPDDDEEVCVPFVAHEAYDGCNFDDAILSDRSVLPALQMWALAQWAAWARWTICATLGLECIVPAMTVEGRTFPEAVVRRSRRGASRHVEATHDDFPGTVLDLGADARQYSFVTDLSTHSGHEGALVVYDVRPSAGDDGAAAYSVDLDAFWPVDTVEIKPLLARSVLFRSDCVHEVLPSRNAHMYAAMSVVVAADGTAVSFA